MNTAWNVMPLFAMPIYQATLGVNEQDRQNVFNESFDRLTVNNGFITEDKRILDNQKYNDLHDKILTNINFFLKDRLGIKDSVDFYITNSWVMKHHRGDYANKHFHENSLLSGIYYLQCDQLSGDLGFEKPGHYQNMFPSVFGFRYSWFNEFNSKQWWFTPKEGELFLFPSHLDHEVKPSESDRERLCIAFNVFFRGDLHIDGKEDIGTLKIR